MHVLVVDVVAHMNTCDHVYAHVDDAKHGNTHAHIHVAFACPESRVVGESAVRG